MIGTANKIVRKLTGKDLQRHRIAVSNYFVRTFTNRKNKFLFILSPPYCGSTLLNEIISTSPAVSVNNKSGTREGQRLPGISPIMFDHKRRWDESLDFDWQFIKNQWVKYWWDMRYPVLLEKSPPNVMRALSINQQFTPAYFIIFFRNPYAHCQSLMNRGGATAEGAAEFALRCLSYQKRNIEQLSDAISISYEQLVNDTASVVQSLIRFLPELESIDTSRRFNAHNFKGEKLRITNLNEEKISNLTKKDLEVINTVFFKEEELLRYFNYKLIG